jgi:hypothetical protein
MTTVFVVIGVKGEGQDREEDCIVVFRSRFSSETYIKMEATYEEYYSFYIKEIELR